MSLQSHEKGTMGGAPYLGLRQEGGPTLQLSILCTTKHSQQCKQCTTLWVKHLVVRVNQSRLTIMLAQAFQTVEILICNVCARYSFKFISFRPIQRQKWGMGRIPQWAPFRETTVILVCGQLKWLLTKNNSTSANIHSPFKRRSHLSLSVDGKAMISMFVAGHQSQGIKGGRQLIKPTLAIPGHWAWDTN